MCKPLLLKTLPPANVPSSRGRAVNGLSPPFWLDLGPTPHTQIPTSGKQTFPSEHMIQRNLLPTPENIVVSSD